MTPLSRNGNLLSALLAIVLACAIPTAGFAQTTTRNHGTTTMSLPKPGVVAAPNSPMGGNANLSAGTFATDLTAAECTNLGGTVRNLANTTLCASGKYCSRSDADYTPHMVCLEVER